MCYIFSLRRFQEKSLLLYGNLYFSIPWLEGQFQHLLGPFSQGTLRSSTKDHPSFDAWFSGFPGGSDGKHLPVMQETQVRSLGWEDPLEKEMATHSSALAWKISWTEESGRLQSMGSQSQTRLSDFTFTFSGILETPLELQETRHTN